MVVFCRSFVESILIFSFIAWYFSLSVSNKNKLHNAVNMSAEISGKQQNCMTLICESRVIREKLGSL